MKKKTKRLIIVAVVTVAVGLVGLNVLAYNHAWAMMHFTTGGDRTTKPEALNRTSESRAEARLPVSG